MRTVIGIGTVLWLVAAAVALGSGPPPGGAPAPPRAVSSPDPSTQRGELLPLLPRQRPVPDVAVAGGQRHRRARDLHGVAVLRHVVVRLGVVAREVHAAVGDVGRALRRRRRGVRVDELAVVADANGPLLDE